MSFEEIMSFDWFGPIAFLVSFASVIGLIFMLLNCKVNKKIKRKKRKFL